MGKNFVTLFLTRAILILNDKAAFKQTLTTLPNSFIIGNGMRAKKVLRYIHRLILSDDLCFDFLWFALGLYSK